MSFLGYMEWQTGCCDDSSRGLDDPNEEQYCGDCGLPLDQCKCEVTK